MPVHPTAPHDEARADGGVFAPDLHDTHHLWLKAVLLSVWVVSSFGVTFYARELQALVPGGQLGYWMAAQGAVLIFMVLVLVYCAAMDYFERQDRLHASAGTTPGQSLPSAPELLASNLPTDMGHGAGQKR